MIHQIVTLHSNEPDKLNGEFSDKFIRKTTYLLSFLVPIFLMLLIFCAKEIFPFGDRSFLRTDLYHQYAPFTKAMRRLLREGGSFFYTWESGLGTNFLSEYGYYLASPTNWLLILIPESLVIEFISYMVILKIGLCGLSMSFYLTKHNQKTDFAIVLFSIFYALSGYISAYSWNIMWLDSIIMFPIVIWAVERLVKEDKCFLYTFTLAFSILTNYYISIMFCLFLPIYFIVQLLLLDTEKLREYKIPAQTVQLYKWPNYWKKIFNFCLFSLLAGGLAAIILVPVFKALFTTASSSGNFQIDADYEPFFSMFDILSRHLMLTDTHQKLDHWPNIYCGVAIFLMLPLYAMNRNIRAREKALYFGLIFFFLISFNQEILEFIWHGLHKPNSLPARQSFIYIFILLCMSYQGWLWLKSATRGQLLGAIAFSIGFAILAEKLVTQEELHWYSYYVSILFFILYGALCYLYIYYKSRRDWYTTFALAALCIVMIESCINMAVTSVTTVSRSVYSKYDEDFTAVLEKAEEAEGDNFYRVERVDRRTKNDGAWYDYNSASIFSSAANASLTDLYKKLGMEGSTNSYCTTGSTWLTDMLLNIQYTLSATPITTVNEDMLTLFAEKENGYLYKNNYNLSLGFMAPLNLDSMWSAASSNPIDNQNELVRDIIGINLFTKINSIGSNTTSSITVDEAGYIYVYINKSSKAKTISVSSDTFSKEFENVNRGYILNLGWHEVGDVIELSCEEEGPMYVNAYRMDLAAFHEVYESLSQTLMVVDSYDNTTVNAHIEISQPGLLLTSIPADEGWTVLVNNEKVTYTEFGDALIALPLYQSGYYDIQFQYKTPGFTLGIQLSLLSLVALFLVFALQRFFHASPFIQGKLAQYKKNEMDSALYELEDTLGKTEFKKLMPTLNETEIKFLEEQQMFFERARVFFEQKMAAESASNKEKEANTQDKQTETQKQLNQTPDEQSQMPDESNQTQDEQSEVPDELNQTQDEQSEAADESKQTQDE